MIGHEHSTPGDRLTRARPVARLQSRVSIRGAGSSEHLVREDSVEEMV
jgi:hypothetical protein